MLNKTAIVLAVQAALLSTSTFAQEDTDKEQEPKGLETITVTAQKRTQTIKEVPAQVSAITQQSVNDYLGAGENIRALAGRVPSLQIESSNGRTSPRFYIRGLGNTDFDVNANQPVAMVVDEVFLENAVLKSLPLFDLARVEVLNGPQGTLFGRNTPAGIVKIDTAAPEFYDYANVRAGYGSRDTWFMETAINAEINDQWATRLSVKYTERGNWIDNVTRGEKVGSFEELAYRLQFLYNDGENTRMLIKLHGFDQDTNMPQVFYANAIAQGTEGLRPGFNEEVIYADAASGGDLEHRGGSLKLEHDMGSMQFTSITGFDMLENFQFTDVDGGNTAFPPVAPGTLGQQLFFNLATGDGLSDHYQFNQEFRLSATSDNLFYQVGVFFFREDLTVDSRNLDLDGQPLTGPGDFTQTDQVTTSHAVFGQVEFTASDDLSITAGLRYTSDEKELDIRQGGTSNVVFEIDADDDYFNWDLAARYTINDEFTTFARIANASRGPVTLGRFGFPSRADTETLTSYEVGLKSELFDRNLRWNITAYTYTIDDQQLTAAGGEGNTNELLNADETVGRGIETDLEAIINDEWRIVFNASYNDTEIKDDTLRADACATTPLCTPLDPIVEVVPGFGGPVRQVSINGNPLPRAPKWLANLILNYEKPYQEGYLYAQTDINYRGDSNLNLYESIEFVAESRALVGVRAGYKTDDGFDIALVGRNITNELTVDGGIDFLNLTAFINEPQFWGVEVAYSF